jgi:hypothetical protein
MTFPEIPLAAWRSLYDAAIKFKGASCWDWMYDDNIFGIQNPHTREIGYACIMGNLGELYALNVYLGADGFAGYKRILEQMDDENDDFSIMHHQHCLQAAFVDRQELAKEDLQIIKNLGYRFRGADAWPQFRNYYPAYFPWYLEQAEVEYLTLAIEQTLDVALRFKDDPSILTPPDSDAYLTRTAHFEGERLIWKDEYLMPPAEEIPVASECEVDEIRIRRIKEGMPKHRGIWQVDMSLYPAPVREGSERPYFPYIFIVMDSVTQMALTTHLCPPGNQVGEFCNAFLEYIEKNGAIPERVEVNKDVIADMLKPLAEALRFNLIVKKRLTCAEDFLQSLCMAVEKGFR